MDGFEVGLNRDRGHDLGEISRARPRLMSWTLRNWSVLAFVALPTLIASIYYAFIAAPQFVSQCQFVVRGQGATPPGVLSSLLQGAASSAASEDAFVVQDYMMSRDAASMLIREDGLRQIFASKQGDALARFPNILHGSSFESFLRYYQAHVVAELDTNTGISTLTVRTFNPSDSRRIVVALMSAGEGLINRMNQRQRQDTVAASTREVHLAEAELRTIGELLAGYRNKEAMLDPNKQSVPMLRGIDDLKTMLTTTGLALSQLEASTPHSPLIPVYQRREAVLRAAIERSNASITGSDTSLVPKITGYDDLTLQQQLAERTLASATSTLEAANVQADRQMLFLEEITTPDLPDYATYPHSLVAIATVFVTTLALYLMGWLLLCGAREHQII